MRRILIFSVSFAVVVVGPTALAQDLELVVSIDTVAHASGVLATEPVPPELQGATCDVTATAENQSSVHPDSNLIVSSGGDSITLLDVEREPGAVTVTNEALTLGSEITVSLEIGPDGIFSGGITLTASCQPPPSPTPTESPSQTPSPTPTESPSATVTHTSTPSDSPPPTVGATTLTPVTPAGGLAFTGPDRWHLLALGSIVLLVIGLGVLRAGYNRRNEV